MQLYRKVDRFLRDGFIGLTGIVIVYMIMMTTKHMTVDDIPELRKAVGLFGGIMCGWNIMHELQNNGFAMLAIWLLVAVGCCALIWQLPIALLCFFLMYASSKWARVLYWVTNERIIT